MRPHISLHKSCPTAIENSPDPLPKLLPRRYVFVQSYIGNRFPICTGYQDHTVAGESNALCKALSGFDTCNDLVLKIGIEGGVMADQFEP